ncbi:hypothetical protein Hypma_009307 [Hypsizygus marmoreus]|uniref:Uncharacterized protein n=1 Tax=Hypsizygus marmoreus TaxID=39966 RepID=A0A369JNH8_HYPMA|nr:hypothetical protein Hypma_009307 [Hypsizygus marmoreus]
MDVAPSKTPAVPKVPIPVEESRAQRLQRQQARFRDRGGIFVPSNRNTLIEILLGRKPAQSPRKSRGRSLSRSPVKPKPKKVPVQSNSADTTTPTDYTSNRRTSPRKTTQKLQLRDGHEGNTEAVAGPSRLPEVAPRKAVKKPGKKPATSRKGKAKIDAVETDNPAPNRRGRPPKSKALVPDPVEAVVEKHPKPKAKRAVKPSTKQTNKKAKDQGSIVLEPEQTASQDADVVVPGINLKGKGKARIPLPLSVDPPDAQALSIALIPGPPKDSTLSHSKPNLELDAHASGPDPAAKHPRRVAAIKDKGVRVGPKDDSLTIRNENELMTLKRPESKADRGALSHPEHLQIDRKGKARQVEVTALEAKDTATEEPQKPIKSSRKRTRAPDPDPALDVSVKEAAGGVVQDTRKRPRVSPNPEKKKPQPRKTQANAKPSKEKVEREPSPDDVPPMERVASASKKRPREPDPDELPEPRVTKVPRKKKKVAVTEDEHAVLVNMADVENSDPAPKKMGTKRKHDAQEAPKTTSAQKSSSSRSVKSIISSTGSHGSIPKPKIKPRKSVMQRIREPLPQIEDDDPDPIDFLS